MSNTVEFDPGIGNLVIDFNNYINNLYSGLMNLKTINQKKVRFKLFSNKIKKNIENNIAFYLGCLLWAYYIHNENIEAPKDIKGNVFLNLSKEEKENYDYKMQTSFLEDYFECFERDTLYYTGKKEEIPQLWKKILSLYTEFLELNNGFISTKTTNDIILPEKLKNADIKTKINIIIQKAIDESNLSILLNNNELNENLL